MLQSNIVLTSQVLIPGGRKSIKSGEAGECFEKATGGEAAEGGRSESEFEKGLTIYVLNLYTSDSHNDEIKSPK